MNAQEVWESISLWELGVVLAAVGGVLFFILKWVVPGIRIAMHFFDDMLGAEARPGVPARPGIMQRMQTMSEQIQGMSTKVDVVHHEMFPNSGASLRDQTNRIEIAQVGLKAALSEHINSSNLRMDESQKSLDDHITESIEVLREIRSHP